jgi:hypothetical protein
VLHWFEHNQPVVDTSGMAARDYAAEAKTLACSLLEEQCGTVALFLTEMAQVRVSGGFVTVTPTCMYFEPTSIRFVPRFFHCV